MGSIMPARLIAACANEEGEGEEEEWSNKGAIKKGGEPGRSKWRSRSHATTRPPTNYQLTKGVEGEVL